MVCLLATDYLVMSAIPVVTFATLILIIDLGSIGLLFTSIMKFSVVATLFLASSASAFVPASTPFGVA